MNQNTITRILAVDDDPNIGKLLNVILAQAGFQVTLAVSGEQALKLAIAQPPDLALVDVMLPGMNGYALCRELRHNPTTSLMPILMLTSQGETRDKLAGFEAGADDYLTKPFQAAELTYRVQALLARSQMPSILSINKPTQRGKVWAVFGAKGGVGKTTVAVNLAIALARQPNTRVALVDADLQFGDVSAHLNLAPSRTILDLLPYVDDMDEELASKILIRHESRVRVLLGPYRPEEAELVSATHVEKILQLLTQENDVIIVDCPCNYDDRTLAILDHSDQIIMVLTPEIGPVKNTSTFLDLAEKMSIPAPRIRIVLNRANSDVGIAAPEIERALQKPISLRIMSGGRPVVLSVNRGVPLMMEQPQHPFSQQIARIAELLRTPEAVGAH